MIIIVLSFRFTVPVEIRRSISAGAINITNAVNISKGKALLANGVVCVADPLQENKNNSLLNAGCCLRKVW